MTNDIHDPSRDLTIGHYAASDEPAIACKINGKSMGSDSIDIPPQGTVKLTDFIVISVIVMLPKLLIFNACQNQFCLENE